MNVELFAQFLAACIVASAAHEATHFAVALVAGRAPTFVVWEWAVFYTAPPDAPHSADYAIALAPLAIGTVVGLALAVTAGLVWWLVPAWYLYTLHGVVTTDLDFDAVDPQTDTHTV